MDFKSEGNQLFKAGRYSEAIERYTAALNHQGDQVVSDEFRMIVLSNRSQCKLNLEQWQAASDDADVALTIDSFHVKSLLRRGSAYEKLGRVSEALKDFAAASEEEPQNKIARTAVHRLRAEQQRQNSAAPKVRADIASSAFAAELETFLDGLDIRDVSVHQETFLGDYSLLGKVPLERKRALVERCRQDLRLDRAMGSMCGMGVGDGMGHMFEFLPCLDTPGKRFFDLKTMEFHGVLNRFSLKYGQWTDDSAMGLCMADSLIIRRGYDGSDIRQRFWNWWERGYNNAFRLDEERASKRSVGLGGNIASSLAEMDDLTGGEMPNPIYGAQGEDAGNGSLMRFAPVALFFHAVAFDDLCHFARQSSFTTHPGAVAAEACAFLSHLIARALKRPSGEPVDPKAFLEGAAEEFLRLSGLEGKAAAGNWRYVHLRWLVTGRPERETERCWEWRNPDLGLAATLKARGSEYNGYPVSPGYFGSYSLDGLAIAMWAVYNTTTFDEAIAKAINTHGDADSHGSICGQIAGALYGLSSVHPQFLEWLNRWDEHEFAARAVLLHEMGLSLASAAQGSLR